MDLILNYFLITKSLNLMIGEGLEV